MDNKVSVVLPKPDKFRFAVGTEGGPRSEFWFIQIENTSDVYASVSSILGNMKLSIHRDRECQFGLSGKSVAYNKLKNGPTSKHYLFRWKRPQTPAIGTLHAASIFIPTEFLNDTPLLIPEDGKLRFIFEPSPKGQAMEFGIFYSMLQHTELEEQFLINGYQPMFYNACKTGETIMIAARSAPFDASSVSASLNPNCVMPEEMRERIARGEVVKGSAIFCYDPHVDGYIRLLDVSKMTAKI